MRVLEPKLGFYHSVLSLKSHSSSVFSVPPTKIEIEGVKSGSRLSVRENEMVELKCIVHQAKPKAQIVWFRENAEFYSGKFNFLNDLSISEVVVVPSRKGSIIC